MPAKATQSTRRTVERIMHAFKQGDLENGRTGRPVTDRKQAIAIALSEAGVPDQASPQKNARNRRRSSKAAAEGVSRAKSTRKEATPSKAELYRQARAHGIAGRSTMSKAERARALAP